MNTEMSAPPSPASDISSESRSSDLEENVEPMDLTEFIGSLNDNQESSNAPQTPEAKRERKASISNDGDAKRVETEWKRLLDADYDYSKYCCPYKCGS